MSTPLVSIIVPIYKVESYLRKCLNSIINQTYSYLEIILVDDGSPDKCPQICDEYAAKDKRIAVIHKKNGGLSDARNVGLDICKGEYISFIDSDDWIAPQYIERLLYNVQNKKVDIAIGQFQKVFLNNENKKNENDNPADSIEVLDNKEAVKRLFSNDEIYFVIACGKLYKKTLFNTIRYPVGKIHEDEYTTYKILYKSSSVAYLHEKLYFYLQRPQSIMSNVTSNSLRVLDARVERYQYFKDNNERYLANLCVEPLCWDLLFAYNQSKQRKTIPGFNNAKGILKKYRELVHHYNEINLWSIRKIMLNIFAICPQVYLLYRKLSPYTIRKE